LYDDDNLYVGGMLYDDAPDKLVVNELKRDFNARDGDLFVLVLDTFDDNRNSYGFQTNPAGAQRDTQSYDDGRNNNQNWDAVWDLRAQITDEGWVLEYAIPFRARVSMRLYDVTGREVRTLIDEEMDPGQYAIVLEASGLSSGVYYFRMTAGDFVQTRKVALVK